MKCEHNWVRSGHGNDLICTKCGYAAAQATLSMPTVEPNLREQKEVGLFNGDEIIKGLVYKDEFEKQLRKAIGLNILQELRR